MNKLVQKSIRFPKKAVELIENDVQRRLGIDFNEFIKIQVINMANEIEEKESWTPQLRKEIEQAKKEVLEGKRPLLKSSQDIKNYLQSLLKEGDG